MSRPRAINGRSRAPQRLAGGQPASFSNTRLGSGSRARSTLSKLWTPTGGLTAVRDETGHGKLIRAGFIRQAQSGIFQLLPLGLRVQEKIEALLDKHMQSIGASKLSLSTITSEKLWRRSGRLDNVASELFRLTDRKQVSLMLSPTHEEEITTLVASMLKSYKDLPLRLYQTTRKYRDEMRPRHGLLRSREFVMKDLYTFDTTYESAITTYKEVSKAYRTFFAELKLPILVAEASSGDMGGDYSHEYHLINPIGEDNVIACDTCDYAANDEVAASHNCSESSMLCPRCEHGKLQTHRALELGHTFHLGSRYSNPLSLFVKLPGTKQPVPVEMGCHGIGVSRIFGAVAEHKVDDKGIKWPRSIAPFEVAVVPTRETSVETLRFYDQMTTRSASGPGFDVVLDDRKDSFGWKMQDADLIGYPVTIVLGKAWREEGLCEVQCRSRSVREKVLAEDVPTFLKGVLSKL